MHHHRLYNIIAQKSSAPLRPSPNLVLIRGETRQFGLFKFALEKMSQRGLWLPRGQPTQDLHLLMNLRGGVGKAQDTRRFPARLQSKPGRADGAVDPPARPRRVNVPFSGDLLFFHARQVSISFITRRSPPRCYAKMHLGCTLDRPLEISLHVVGLQRC